MKTKNNTSIYVMDTKGYAMIDGKEVPLSTLPKDTPLIYETPNRAFALLLAINDIAKAYKVDPSHVAIKYHDMLRVIE